MTNTLTSAVAHTLYVVADSTNQVAEQSETKNRASVVGPIGGLHRFGVDTDLGVALQWVPFSPLGGPCTLV